jgi:hypothetical protein
MAITIIQSPQAFTTIGNPMTFTLESDNYAQPNFMFVCDVYRGGTLITKLKAFPNPSTNYGYFNIREILRFFIDINTSISDGEGFECPDMWTSYTVEFSEQYSGASATTYDFTGTVYCGAIETLNFPSYQYERYVCSTSAPLNPIKLLTNRQQSTKAVALESFAYLQSGYLYIPCVRSSAPNVDWVHITYYAADNSVIRDYFYKTRNWAYHDGGDPNENSVIAVPFMPLEIFEIDGDYTSDGEDGEFYFNLVVDGEGAYYSIRLSIDDTGANYLSDEYFVFIDRPCTRYEFTEIHFQNQLGGVDSYVFTKPKREVQNITRVEASRPLLRETSNAYTYNVSDYSKYNASVDYQKTFNVSSDWLTDSEFEWLSEMVRSPRVWLRSTYVEQGTGIVFPVLVPIIITDTSYNVWKRDFDLLKTLSVNFKYTFDETSPL